MTTVHCPKCDADISDTFEPADPSVGIMTGGWFCDTCDESVGEHEIERDPLPDDVEIFHVARKEIDPTIPQAYRCPEHPDLEPEAGFGLAGGGYGVYTYCRECGRIISKIQTD